MKSYWLNKKNNRNLIVFFSGWSFDENPFKPVDAANNDILIVYDYNNLTIPDEFNEFKTYENKTLISWSMGVFTAYKLRKLFADFDKKIAINGTITPVDNEFGIPVRIFELTLKTVEKGIVDKFYKNVFLTDEEYGKYSKTPVKRSIQNRAQELSNLYKMIQESDNKYSDFYDFALVSSYDKIIPNKNQLNSHKTNGINCVELPYGHFPFYNFPNWDEIINAGRL